MRKSDSNVVPVAGIINIMCHNGKSSLARNFGGIARFIAVVAACLGTAGAILFADVALGLTWWHWAGICAVLALAVLVLGEATARCVEEDE
jgi:hypothetical protein